MQQTVVLAVVVLLLDVSLLIEGQQYMPVPVLIPTILLNQSAPGYPRPPGYDISNSFNNGYNYSSSNNGYRPPGSYIGNQFPNYPQYKNNSQYSPSYNGSADGHLFLGQIQLHDRLLFNQVYRKEKRWWGTREKTIEYPAAVPAGYNRHEIISAIRIYNQFLDGNSARASVVKGGVGYQYVKILLQSGWNKGFQYLVQIYGH